MLSTLEGAALRVPAAVLSHPIRGRLSQQPQENEYSQPCQGKLRPRTRRDWHGVFLLQPERGQVHVSALPQTWGKCRPALGLAEGVLAIGQPLSLPATSFYQALLCAPSEQLSPWGDGEH